MAVQGAVREADDILPSTDFGAFSSRQAAGQTALG